MVKTRKTVANKFAYGHSNFQGLLCFRNDGNFQFITLMEVYKVLFLAPVLKILCPIEVKFR